MKIKIINGLLVVTGSFFALSSGTFYSNNTNESNTVPIVFSTGDGKFKDGSAKKVYEVRTGIKWSQLKEGFEKPKQIEVVPPTSTLTFTNAWLDESGEVIDNNYQVSKSITVTASYGAESFATAPWSLIAKFFDEEGVKDGGKGTPPYKGTEGLANYFGYKWENGACPNLIGQERYLMYAGEPRKVVVIGYNTDLVEKTNDQTVFGSLTFQFAETITDAPFNYEENNYYDGVDSSKPDEPSHLKSYLNNAVLNNIEKDVRDMIVPVKKWTYRNDTNSIQETNNNKVFALSLKEMNATPMAHGEAKKDEGLSNSKGDTHVVSYPFYAKDNKGKYEFPKEGEGRTNLDPIIKNDANGNPTSYWTRSADNYSDSSSSVYSQKYNYIVDENGNIGQTQKVNYTCGVAPAFCYGKTVVKKESFLTCDWKYITDIIDDARNETVGTPSSGLADLKAAFTDDDENTEYPNSFIGLKRTVNIYGFPYEVRVIGENHDYLASEYNGVKDAALTFELTHAVSHTAKNTYSDSVKSQFGKNNCVNFLEDGYINTKVQNMKNNIESSVKDKLKTVKKYYPYRDSKWAFIVNLGNWETKTYATECFPLSFKELGGDKSWNCLVRRNYIEWFQKKDLVKKISDAEYDMVYNHNDGSYSLDKCYKYYYSNTAKVQDSKRVKKIYTSSGGDGKAITYSTREAMQMTSMQGILDPAWCNFFGVNTTGYFGDERGSCETGTYWHDDSLYISFAFCL